MEWGEKALALAPAEQQARLRSNLEAFANQRATMEVEK
jgi:hypothetical protein